MGLDWLPEVKPKPGHGAELVELLAKIEVVWKWQRKKMRARIEEISISPYETLEAPRVGFDERATAWALERYRERQDQDWSEEKWMKHFHGYYVLDLAPPGDGLPQYTNGGLGEYVEAFSFRAAFLEDCEEILEYTYYDAYNAKSPEELVEYGKSLIDKAEAYAARKKIDLKSLDPTDPNSDAFRLDVVLSAGRWCMFWGERGHPLEPWF